MFSDRTGVRSDRVTQLCFLQRAALHDSDEGPTGCGFNRFHVAAPAQRGHPGGVPRVVAR